MKFPLWIGMAATLTLGGLACAEPGRRVPNDKVRVLILDGQNNHDYVATTKATKATLLACGRFTVDVSTSPGKGAPKEQWDQWRPDFSKYQVVLSNYNGQEWPDEVKKAYVKFVEEGGGVVNVHAANNPFKRWETYNRMIGLGWRNNKFGDRITMGDNGKIIRTAKGSGPKASHGPQHAFVVRNHGKHPITRGLPKEWMHAKDELYHGQRGPARNMHVIMSAYSDPKLRGTGAREPMTWIIPFGKGHVVTTVLGHHAKRQKDFLALHCVGFQTLLARSVEWAATGKVTIPVPASFPGREEAAMIEPHKLNWE